MQIKPKRNTPPPRSQLYTKGCLALALYLTLRHRVRKLAASVFNRALKKPLGFSSFRHRLLCLRALPGGLTAIQEPVCLAPPLKDLLFSPIYAPGPSTAPVPCYVIVPSLRSDSLRWRSFNAACFY